MSKTFQVIDQDMLLNDGALHNILIKIKEKLMQGFVVELKTSTQPDSKSMKSSLMMSHNSSIMRDQMPLTVPLSWKNDIDPLNTLSNRDTPLIQNISYCNPMGPKMDNYMPQPEVVDQLLSESSHKSLDSDEEPQNIKFLSARLKEIETVSLDGDLQKMLEQTKALYSQIVLLIFRTQRQKEYLQQYTILAVQSLCHWAILNKKMGHFNDAIKQLETCIYRFQINDPNIQGKMLIEIGKLFMQLIRFDKANDYFYQALIHYEQLRWKLDIAYVLKYMARIAALENFEDAKKLCYEAIAITKDFLNPLDEQLADIYLVLAETYFLAKESDLAFEFIGQAIDIRIFKYNTNKHQSLVQSYNLLGLIYASCEDYPEAIVAYKEALSCQQQQTLSRGQILNNLGVAFASLNKLDKSSRCFEIAYQIYSEYLPKNHTMFIKLDQNKQQLLN